MECFNTNIYPIADLLIKIIIGIIVVIYLHRRTYRDKIKEKLIDSYIEYLDKYKNFTKYELYLDRKIFYIKLLEIIKANITDKSTQEAALQKINIELQNINTDYDDNWYETKADFTPYTYKFCFLIGARYYFKHIQPLENELTNYLLDNSRHERTINKIISKIECAKEITNLSISNIDEIISSIKESYSKEIITIHQKENMKHFNKYSNKIADKIDKM